jgi:hypothetical protein
VENAIKCSVKLQVENKLFTCGLSVKLKYALHPEKLHNFQVRLLKILLANYVSLVHLLKIKGKITKCLNRFIKKASVFC